jgi:hypothetical protein
VIVAIWDDCVEAGAIIYPFIAYSEYVDGNEHESKRLGLRFVALQADPSGVIAAGEMYVDIDECVTDPELVADTPEGALQKYLERRGRG